MASLPQRSHEANEENDPIALPPLSRSARRVGRYLMACGTWSGDGYTRWPQAKHVAQMNRNLLDFEDEMSLRTYQRAIAELDTHGLLQWKSKARRPDRRRRAKRGRCYRVNEAEWSRQAHNEGVRVRTQPARREAATNQPDSAQNGGFGTPHATTETVAGLGRQDGGFGTAAAAGWGRTDGGIGTPYKDHRRDLPEGSKTDRVVSFRSLIPEDETKPLPEIPECKSSGFAIDICRCSDCAKPASDVDAKDGTGTASLSATELEGEIYALYREPNRTGYDIPA